MDDRQTGDAAFDRRLLAALAQARRARRTVTYRQLADECGWSGTGRIRRVTAALERLICADHRAGQPLRAAVAVSSRPPGLPGAGFFRLCRAIDRYFGPETGPQAAAFHQLELARLFDAEDDG